MQVMFKGKTLKSIKRKIENKQASNELILQQISTDIMNSRKCQICDEPSQQIKVLLRGLKKRLIYKNKKQDQEYQETKSDQKNNHTEVFTRVVDIITLGHANGSRNCNHKKTYREFYRKMRCSQAQFKQNCLEVLQQIANKCYQLDVVVQQVTLFEDRVLQIMRQSRGQSKSKELQARGKVGSTSQPFLEGCAAQNKESINRPNQAYEDLRKNMSGEEKGTLYQMQVPNQTAIFYLPFFMPNFDDN